MTAVAHVTAPRTTPSSPAESGLIARMRRSAGPFALVAGPIIGTAGMAIHPPGTDDDTALAAKIADQSAQWFASHLMLAAGWAALAIGLASVTRIAGGPRGNLVFVGAVVGAVGAAIMSVADLTHGVVAYALAGQVDPARSIAIQEAYFKHPAVGLIMIGAMLLPAGMLMLGAGVLRARSVPRWAGAVLLVSPLVVQAAGAAGPGELLCGIPLIVGTTMLARVVVRA